MPSPATLAHASSGRDQPVLADRADADAVTRADDAAPVDDQELHVSVVNVNKASDVTLLREEQTDTSCSAQIIASVIDLQGVPLRTEPVREHYPPGNRTVR